MGKKQHKKGDFQKVKLKVGKKLPKHLNETKVQLQTGRIQLRDQILMETSTDSQGWIDLLHQAWKRLHSNQMEERLGAIDKVCRLIQNVLDEEIANGVRKYSKLQQIISLQDVIKDVAPLLRDSSSNNLKTKAAGLLDLLIQHFSHLTFYHEAFLHCLTTTWNHLDENVNTISLNIFSSLLQWCPQCLLPKEFEIRLLLVRWYRRISKSAILKDMKHKISVLHLFCRFTELVRKEDHFDVKDRPLQIDNHLFDVRVGVFQRCQFSWNSEKFTNQNSAPQEPDLLDSDFSVECFLETLWTLFWDINSGHVWSEMIHDAKLLEQTSTLLWCLNQLVNYQWYSSVESTNKSLKNLKQFVFDHLFGNFPFMAKNKKDVGQMNLLVLEVLLSTPLILPMCLDKQMKSFAKQLHAFLSEHWSGAITNTNLIIWLRILTPLLVDVRISGAHIIVRLFVAFFMRLVQQKCDAKRSIDDDSTRQLISMIDLATSSTLKHLASCQTDISNSTEIMEPFVSLPRLLLQVFDSCNLHSGDETASDQQLSLASSAIHNLLRLDSVSFSNSREVLTSNSHRLISFCPDVVLKRSLKVLLL